MNMKLIYKVVIVLLIGVTLELGYFNFDYFREYMDKSTKKNILYTMGQMEIQNWTTTDTGLVSEIDPMLIIRGVDTKVKRIKLEVKTQKPTDYILLFYTNETIPIFNDSDSILYNVNEVQVIDKYVKDLRIDIGDKAGTKLEHIEVIINPMNFIFSISRIIAILMIYLLGRFLFTIQQSPDYGLK